MMLETSKPPKRLQAYDASKALSALVPSKRRGRKQQEGQSKLATFFNRPDGERSPIRMSQSSTSERTVCPARVEMQVFHASIRRTNPIAQEIVDDLDDFLQADHSKE